MELFDDGGMGREEKIGTIPGGISPFDFVYSSFIGGIIGLICNLDSSSALSSSSSSFSTGSILVQGREDEAQFSSV